MCCAVSCKNVDSLPSQGAAMCHHLVHVCHFCALHLCGTSCLEGSMMHTQHEGDILGIGVTPGHDDLTRICRRWLKSGLKALLRMLGSVRPADVSTWA